jgi:hypothetical protein
MEIVFGKYLTTIISKIDFLKRSCSGINKKAETPFLFLVIISFKNRRKGDFF